jgi:hypothetical protein
MHVGMQLMSWHEPKPAGIRSGDAEDLVAGFLPGDMPRWGSRYCTLVCSHMAPSHHRKKRRLRDGSARRSETVEFRGAGNRLSQRTAGRWLGVPSRSHSRIGLMFGARDGAVGRPELVERPRYCSALVPHRRLRLEEEIGAQDGLYRAERDVTSTEHQASSIECRYEHHLLQEKAGTSSKLFSK